MTEGSFCESVTSQTKSEECNISQVDREKLVTTFCTTPWCKVISHGGRADLADAGGWNDAVDRQAPAARGVSDGTLLPAGSSSAERPCPSTGPAAAVPSRHRVRHRTHWSWPDTWPASPSTRCRTASQHSLSFVRSSGVATLLLLLLL